MSKLKTIRELKNLTQEELSEKSGVSVRTIQRIEAGKEPKGYTLRVLAQTFNITEEELQDNTSKTLINESGNTDINLSRIKLINLSSIPFIIIPPLNIVIPLILMLVMKEKNDITKQIISVQILWTIMAPILFMLGIFLKFGNQFTLIIMILIVLSNVFITLRNAAEIHKNKTLYYKLNFNLL
jgi:transcriptional regulator with XRE-family HTH domain